MTDMMAAPPAPDAGATAGGEVTVCIEMDKATGQYSVGILPEGVAPGAAEGAVGEEGGEKSYLQPAQDLSDALRQAKALFETPQSTDGGPSPFEKGFAKVRPPPPDMGGTAGGY